MNKVNTVYNELESFLLFRLDLVLANFNKSLKKHNNPQYFGAFFVFYYIKEIFSFNHGIFQI